MPAVTSSLLLQFESTELLLVLRVSPGVVDQSRVLAHTVVALSIRLNVPELSAHSKDVTLTRTDFALHSIATDWREFDSSHPFPLVWPIPRWCRNQNTAQD